MAFDSLSEKLNHVFSKMREKGKLTDLEIKQAMREIRIALLEADVNFQVVRDFINKVSEKASGEDILKGLNSTQQVIKIVNDELIALMGSTHSKLAVADRPPTIIMMCGLQGCPGPARNRRASSSVNLCLRRVLYQTASNPTTDNGILIEFIAIKSSSRCQRSQSHQAAE